MYIKKVTLDNFRNYDNQEIEFCDNINIIYGDNAQGKTNIIEAIFFRAIGKSFRTNKDSELIKLNKEKAIINVKYEASDRDGNINIEISDKKRVKINVIPLKKLSEIIIISKIF